MLVGGIAPVAIPRGQIAGSWAQEWNHFGMSVNDESAAPRSFAAHPPFPLSKALSKVIDENGRPTPMYLVWFGSLLAAVLGGIYVWTHAPAGWTHGSAATVVVIVLVMGVLAYAGWHNTREILICVTGEGLTVNLRRGDVFSFSDAKLGLWAYGSKTKTMGAALHLRSGPHHFVLGGRDHRIGTGTRLDEPPAGYVDAWMWAGDFDELLTIVSRRSALDVHRPAPGEPTRCLLFPNVELTNHLGWRFFKSRRLVNSARQPRLAIDVGEDGIRVIDPNSTALVATAAPAQVSATRAKHNCWRKGCHESFVLVLRVPGLQPLTVRCLDPASFGRTYNTPRFSWRGEAQEKVKTPADYSVSGMDWLTLVEKFGFAPYLQDRANRGSG